MISPYTAPLEFRFYCKEHGYIQSGFDTPIESVHFNQRGELGLACPKCFKSRPMDIEQYTGRDDTNGVKVFAADVVRYSKFDNLAQIEWTEDLCQWTVCTRIYDGDGPDDFTLLGEPIDPDCSIEVVGNVHDKKYEDVI